ncbi:carboxy-S-adenosyl-L-methionine synthase CmoA [Helicobacter aurati]|uniref:Carboxy-S-adenosyl-L-methionine synthase n=2 Tax=Helicobacter aurati TaxID=137778 RepID=A0A3D8J9E9_9HELI|nr:carboxy-S-adenosyl-L-methionine synthase CmoA [Helicobacter aurati]RDU73491.1 carboxy-S-adenosyl-L-methionine synthase CmoA [Helicobacter aurati]
MQSNTISTQQDKKKDTFFAKECIQKFEFTSSVASVFDDMLERSIPFYYEVIQLSIYFIKQHLGYFPTRDSHAESKHAQTTVDLTMLPKLITIYDLGSSTGNFLLQLDEALKAIKWRKLRLYGIDNSQAMIAHSKLKAQALNSRAQFFCYDLLQYHFQSCNVIVAHYTLQFIRPPQRLRLIKKIYESLENGGIFIFAEKVISEDKELESQMLSCYYNYKAQKGYSQKEIYKKREALENILVPYSTQENIAMLKQAGFNRIEIMFKWVNFALFLAKKD